MKRQLPILSLVLCLTSMLSSTLSAQNQNPNQDRQENDSAADSTYLLDNVTVTGSAMPIELEKVASSISIIRADDPLMQQIRTPDEALQYVPGVYVERARGISTTGTHTSITLRGTGAANRTLILKDGVPANDAYTGGVGIWNTLATKSLSRIEIVRGPGSSIYGSNSMGGTVNLVTKDPTPRPTLGAHFSYGSLNTLVAGMEAGKAFDNGWGVIAFAEYKQTDGYQYMADSLWKGFYQTPSNELFNLNAKVSYRINRYARLEAIVDQHIERPVTGTATIYQSDYTTGNYLLRYKGSDPLFTYNVSAYYNRQKRITNSLSYSESSSDFDIRNYDSQVPIDAFGGIAKLNKNWGSHSVTLGADFRFTRVSSRKHTYEKGDQNFSGDQNFISFFVNDDISLGERANLNLGLRYDNWQNTNGKFYDNATGEEIRFAYDRATSQVLSPKLGFTYRATPSMRLRTTFAMGFKAPSIYYMYNAAPLGTSFRLGNPALKPERMTYSVDLGADLRLNDKLEAGITGYASSFRDFIDNVLIDPSEVPSYFDPQGLPVRQHINIGKVDLQGLEASLRYEFLPGTTLLASYAYNNSEIRRYQSNTAYEGNELEDSPASLFTLGLDYRNDRLFNVNAWLRRTGPYFSNMENSVDRKVPSATVADLKISKKVNIKPTLHTINIYAQVFNLFDEIFWGSYTSPTSYYYAPPRTFSLGVGYEF